MIKKRQPWALTTLAGHNILEILLAPALLYRLRE